TLREQLLPTLRGGGRRSRPEGLSFRNSSPCSQDMAHKLLPMPWGGGGAAAGGAERALDWAGLSRGRRLAQIGCVLVVALLAAFVLVGRPPETHLTAAVTYPSPSSAPRESPTPAPWNLDEDIGAVMVVSWRGAVPFDAVRPLLINDQIGGVLLFTPNFGGD